MASYTIGELAPFVGVPKITAYIVVGMIAGPHPIRGRATWIGCDSSTKSLSYIALTAGSKLDIAKIGADDLESRFSLLRLVLSS